MKSKHYNWNSVPLASSLALHVPRYAGVYVIAKVERVRGLPLRLLPIYAGKSLNLRRRFLQHTNPWKSHNSRVSEAVRSEELEFWYERVAKTDLDSAERTLVRQANPPFNIVKFGGVR